MNPITFNDQIKAALDAMRDTRDVPKDWYKSPLFVFETEMDSGIKLVKEQGSQDFFENVPYPCLRLSYHESRGEGNKYSLSILMVHARGVTSLIGAVSSFYVDGKEPSLAKRSKVWLAACNLMWQEEIASYSHDWSIGVHGKWVPSAKHAELDTTDEAQAMVNGMVSSAAVFVLSAMSPNVHVAQVRPDRPNKSVQWTEARTHYTLISHGHPANSKEVSHGESVRVDREGELTRMAHSRRAHYKTLRHERYRFARGKRIFVKATWVGPKEWKDEGSKQIYKILEEVKQ